MTEQTDTTKVVEPEPSRRRRPRRPIGGIVLIIIGALMLADNLWPGFSWMQYWPVILIIIGVALLWRP